MFDFYSLLSNDICVEEHCPFTFVQDITVSFRNKDRYRLIVLLHKDKWKHNAYCIDETHPSWKEMDPEIIYNSTEALSLDDAKLLFFEYRFNDQIYGF